MVYKFCDKKFTSDGAIKSKNTLNQRLAVRLTEELHKPITKQFEKRRVYSSFAVNIWGWWSCGYR